MHVLFDRFEFDAGRRALLSSGQQIHLSPRAFRLLDVLVSGAPRALSKQELIEAVWPETFVEESSLATLVTELRSALGDSARSPRFVRTVHGFGYAFCCDTESAAPRKRAGSVEFAGEQIPLYEGENVLGRDPSADIVIDHVTVSRLHACIIIKGGSTTLRDLASKNGTFVDGVRIEHEVTLDPGSSFLLGDARVVFRRGLGARSTVTASHRATKG